MLDIIKVIILGIVQGLTEFLPISSSGHLVLASELLNFHEEGVAFEVVVHLGSLLSVFFVFKEDIIQMIKAPFALLIKSKMTDKTKEYLLWDLYIIIGTLPAAFIGLLFKSEIESAFSNIGLVILMLAITGTILVSSRFVSEKDTKVTGIKGLVIGFAQALAILPGISRSGSTIVTGIFLGLNRETAARFSFILVIPAILGASFLKGKDLIAAGGGDLSFWLLLIGAVASFISGYVAIVWLLSIVKKGKLEWFGYYCYFIVIISIIWFYILN